MIHNSFRDGCSAAEWEVETFLSSVRFKDSPAHREDYKADLKELWKVVKLLLALSHGQATVERGFSSNKEVMVENLA